MSQKRELDCAWEAPLVSVTKRLCCLSLGGDSSTLVKHCSENISSGPECGDEVNSISKSTELKHDVLQCAMSYGNIGYKRTSKAPLIMEGDPWRMLFDATFKAWKFCSNCNERIEWNSEFPYPTVYYHEDSWFYHTICHTCMQDGFSHWLQQTQSASGIEDGLNCAWRKAIADFHLVKCEQRALWWNVSASSVLWTVNRSWFFFSKVNRY